MRQQGVPHSHCKLEKCNKNPILFEDTEIRFLVSKHMPMKKSPFRLHQKKEGGEPFYQPPPPSPTAPSFQKSQQYCLSQHSDKQENSRQAKEESLSLPSSRPRLSFVCFTASQGKALILPLVGGQSRGKGPFIIVVLQSASLARRPVPACIY